MIVPSKRMLWLWGFLGIPLCTAAIFGITSVWLILVLLAITAAADAYRGQDVTRSLIIHTEESIKLIRSRESELTIRVANGSNRSMRVRIAPDFPCELQAMPAVMPVTQLPSRNEFAWTLRLRANERGKWAVTSCWLDAQSPSRLWQIRVEKTLNLTAHVYPDLSSNKTAVLLMHHRLGGLKSYRQVGNGREFEKLRDYSAGDTYDQIYWKASAKRARLMTKIFQVERAQPCYVLVDCSRQPAQSLDAFVEAALVLGLAAEHYGDQFGVLTFSDRIHAFEPAHSGKKQLARCRGALYALRPRPVSADFAELTRFLQTNLRKRALLFLLTNLDDPYTTELLAAHIKPLAARHAMVVGAIRQQPVQPVFNGPKPESINDIYGGLAGHLAWTKLKEAGRRIESLGAQLALCDAHTIYDGLVNRYREIHQRQLV